MLKTQGDSLKVYNASRDGIIIYATDGYEDTTISDVTEEMITLNDHETLTLSNNTKVQAGDPVYKPVSYTHLDVYKRQIKELCMI